MRKWTPRAVLKAWRFGRAHGMPFRLAIDAAQVIAWPQRPTAEDLAWLERVSVEAREERAHPGEPK